MKKIFYLMLLCATMGFLYSCEKSEEDTIEDYPSIIGSWSEIVDESQEGNISSVVVTTWTFRENQTATHDIKLYMNEVEMISEKIDYTYLYPYPKTGFIHFIPLAANGKFFQYEITVNGNHMKLGNAENGYFNLTKKQ
ncbi:MAG: hypothetical protein IJ477_06355 [Alistipes sp.]|nr:hypothetical protein [Alistipes sp.]